MVKFSPYFHLVNESSLDVEVAEEGNMKNWVGVDREKKIDFWPGNSESLVVRLKGERAQVSTPIKLVDCMNNVFHAKTINKFTLQSTF